MKRHLKRLAAPATWNIKRKSTKFIARPFPNGHSMHLCISLNVFMKEIAGYAKTTKEVKTILHNKPILVNGRRRTDHRSAAGFLDVIEIGDATEAVRVIIDSKGKIGYIKIPAKEAALKVCKIIGKKLIRGNKQQLNLNDGQNFLVTGAEKYNVGDSVVVDIKNNKLGEHLPFGKNATVFLIGGKQIGYLGKIIDINSEKVIIQLQTKDREEYKTGKESIFVVGKDDHPIITVQ